MPYELTIDEDNETIQVRLWDFLTSDEHRAARRNAVQLCVEHQFRRLLIDLRDLKTQNVSTTGSCYDFGESLTEGAVPQGTFLAHVMPIDATARRDVQFTLTVAKNRGGSVEGFTTAEEASRWLLSHPRE